MPGFGRTVQGVLAALMIFGAPAALGDPLPVATAARIVGDEARTRFVADLSRGLDVAAFVLGNPYRAIIDLPGAYQVDDGAMLAHEQDLGAHKPGGVLLRLRIDPPDIAAQRAAS